MFAKEDDEEMDKEPLEKSTEAEKSKNRLKFTTVKATDSNACNGANSPDKNEITVPEKITVTEEHLPKISTNGTTGTIEPSEITDSSSGQNQNHNPPKSKNQTEFDTVFEACNQDNSRKVSNAAISDKSASASKTTSESLPSEIQLEKASSKPFSNEISSKASNEITSDPSSCAIISNDTSTQSSQALPIEATHIPSQNIEPKSPVITTQPFSSVSAVKSATFHEEVTDTSQSLVKDTNALVSENNKQNLPANVTIISSVDTDLAINAERINEAPLLQQAQIQQSPPISVSESFKTQKSPSVSTQTSSETSESESEVAQICTIVPASESLDNLRSISNKNTATPNLDVDLNEVSYF
uniref:PAM2 domain-containing protein n=1 Tax=Elaeophora elaphi TaxID=1147741 RepID=A0A0R3S128_9BILA